MSATGTVTLDFGAYPGQAVANVAVAQTSILSTSFVEAWLVPIATADHSADEHVVENMQVIASAPTVGVGFSVYGRNTGPGDTRLYGTWSVNWVWL